MTASGANSPGRSTRRGVTYYHFEYGTTTGLGAVDAAGGRGLGERPGPVSIAVSGLQPATTYYFALVASNQEGIGRVPRRR